MTMNGSILLPKWALSLIVAAAGALMATGSVLTVVASMQDSAQSTLRRINADEHRIGQNIGDIQVLQSNVLTNSSAIHALRDSDKQQSKSVARLLATLDANNRLLQVLLNRTERQK